MPNHCMSVKYRTADKCTFVTRCGAASSNCHNHSAIDTLALAPLLVGFGKIATNVFTPSQIRRYGGFAPYVKIGESYPAYDHPRKRGRGFPAGHASGGFALVALAGHATTRRGRAIAVAMGLTVGWLMGLYQMLKGAHYLSHTVLTALVCWIVFLILRRALKPAQPDH
jgi:membrane-associated PAP2 superfamily phosphatase